MEKKEEKIEEKIGCFICNEELVYDTKHSEYECSLCGKKFTSNIFCKNGHFVCDECHTKKSQEPIKTIAKLNKSKNPIEIANLMMKEKSVHMHGPEHHILVAAALLCAYRNCGGEILDFDDCLMSIEVRGKQIPGGVCGSWGACGAAISAGIFFSVTQKGGSLSTKTWGLSNILTGSCLIEIGKLSGPRCCKRDTFTAILVAIDFVKEHLGIEMERELPKCGFSDRNRQCKKVSCPYYA